MSHLVSVSPHARDTLLPRAQTLLATAERQRLNWNTEKELHDSSFCCMSYHARMGDAYNIVGVHRGARELGIVKLTFVKMWGRLVWHAMAKHPLHRDTTSTFRRRIVRCLLNTRRLRVVKHAHAAPEGGIPSIGCCNRMLHHFRSSRNPFAVSGLNITEDSMLWIDSSSILLLWGHLRTRDPVLHHSLASTPHWLLALLVLAFDY